MLLTDADRIDPYRLTRAEADLLDVVTIALTPEQRMRLLGIVDKSAEQGCANRIARRLCGRGQDTPRLQSSWF